MEILSIWQRDTVTTTVRRRKLISVVGTWIRRKHCQIYFYLTQFGTGHEVFGGYLQRFKLEDGCCYGEVDTA